MNSCYQEVKTFLVEVLKWIKHADSFAFFMNYERWLEKKRQCLDNFIATGNRSDQLSQSDSV